MTIDFCAYLIFKNTDCKTYRKNETYADREGS